jgi:hypothetical protein
MANFDNIIQEINTNLPNNNSQAITAAKLRTTLIDLTNQIDTVQDDFETTVNDSLANITVDNLTSSETEKALSANQGQELKNRANTFVFTGAGNDLVSYTIYCYANHKYRIYPSKTDIDFTGITCTDARYVCLGIYNYDENYENAATLYYRGCDDLTSPYQEYYDVIAQQNGYMTISIRAAVNESFKFIAIDTTSNNAEDETNLYNPLDNTLANAKDVSKLQMKLEDVDGYEEKIQPTYVSEEGVGIRENGTEFNTAGWQWGTFSLPQNVKRVRFQVLNYISSTTPTAGWQILDDDNRVLYSSAYEHTVQETKVEDFFIEIPNGGTKLKTNIKSPVMNDFYCYVQYGDTVNDLIPKTEYIVDLSYVKKSSAIIDSTGNYVSSGSKSSIIKIEKNKGNIIRIEANGQNGFIISFLKSLPTINQPVDVPTTFSPRYSYGAQAVVEIEIEQDFNYLYILRTNNSGNNTTPVIKYMTKKTLNILAIGNSNDITSLAYIPKILQQILPDYNITLGVAYIGVGNISDHLYMYNNGNPLPYNGYVQALDKYAYYYVWRNAWYYETKLVGYTLRDMLKSRNWDIVKFELQRADYTKLLSNDPVQKAEVLTNIKDLRNIVLNEVNANNKFKFITSTGGITKDTTYDSFTDYYNDYPKEVYSVIKNNVGCDFFLPIGTAVNIARTNSELSQIGTPTTGGTLYPLLFNDNTHLNAGFPCLLSAYTVIVSILKNLYIDGSIYNKNLWVPTNTTAVAIGAQAIGEPNPSNRKMTYGLSLGTEDSQGNIIERNITASKEIAIIANNTTPDLTTDDYSF